MQKKIGNIMYVQSFRMMRFLVGFGVRFVNDNPVMSEKWANNTSNAFITACIGKYLQKCV